MLLPDVNVLVYAHRREIGEHERYRTWLDGARSGDEPIGWCDPVLSGFLRIVTNRRIFAEPTPLAVGFQVCDALVSAPGSHHVVAGARHWELFRAACDAISAHGNDVPDAYLAALAMEQRGTLVSADEGFGRFPSLRWSKPVA